MNPILYVLWLTNMAWSMLRHYWPLTLGLVAAVGVASIFNFPFLRSRFKRGHLLVFAPIGLTFVILIWGSVMRHDDSQSLAPVWPGHVIIALLVVQVLTGIGVVLAMKGYRWFTVSAVLLELWVGLACAFIAGMSVTGDWL